jgi:hypothetical protein
LALKVLTTRTELSIIRLLRLAIAVAAGSVGAVLAQSALTDTTAEAAWIAKASLGLDPRATDTLARIKGTHRQLLALRAYLRAGDTLSGRWSWSQQQLDAYPSTPEGQAAATDIAAVEAAFVRANPGYTAYANRMPRSLEQQLQHWNENAAVAAVADGLAASLHRQFPPQSSPDAAALRTAQITWEPRSAAPLAAPGLSAHGQGRAFDFQILRNGRPVAGFSVSSARQQWDAAGWTRRLHAAVVASGRPFTGPLQSPYEPWHYLYTPRQVQ